MVITNCRADSKDFTQRISNRSPRGFILLGLATTLIMILVSCGGGEERDRYVIFVQGICSKISHEFYDPVTNEYKDDGPLHEVRDWLKLEENGGYTDEFIRYFSYNHSAAYAGSYAPNSKFADNNFIIPYTDGATLKQIEFSSPGIQEIYESIPSESQIDIISHSMGGVVALFALSDNDKLRNRTHSVVTLDSPLQGSDGFPLFVGPRCALGLYSENRGIYKLGAKKDLANDSVVIGAVKTFNSNGMTLLNVANLADRVVPAEASWVDSESSVKVQWRIYQGLLSWSHDGILRLPNAAGEPLETTPIAACIRLALSPESEKGLPKCIAISDRGNLTDKDGGKIGAGTTKKKRINPDGDVDIYIFRAEKSQTVKVTLITENPNSDANDPPQIILNIFDSLAFPQSTDSEQNGNETTQKFIVTSTGSFIVAVSSNDGTGDYHLRLELP